MTDVAQVSAAAPLICPRVMLQSSCMLYHDLLHVSFNPLGSIADISAQLAQYRFVASYSEAMCDKELTTLLEIC